MCRLLVLDASCWSCWMRLVGLVFVWMRFCFQYSGVSFFEETLGCFLSVCAEERDVTSVLPHFRCIATMSECSMRLRRSPKRNDNSVHGPRRRTVPNKTWTDKTIARGGRRACRSCALEYSHKTSSSVWWIIDIHVRVQRACAISFTQGVVVWCGVVWLGLWLGLEEKEETKKHT